MRSITIDEQHILVGFDVVSLFTNIPVEQTIDIICDQWYRSEQDPLKVGESPLSEQNLRRLLRGVTKDVHFAFNSASYKQVDGLAMGSPLSGSFAEIFVGYHELKLLETFRPLSYCRYVDDCHVIINRCEYEQFRQCLSSLHENLRFTADDGDHFLDVKLHVIDNRIETSVYRKPTYCGMYINYDAFCPRLYKVNLVRCLFKRGRQLCSPSRLHHEMSFLTQTFTRNGYPRWFIDKHSVPIVRAPIPTAEKKVVFFSIPYLGNISVQEARSVTKMVESAYTHIQVKVWYRTRTGGRNAPKDTIPPSHRSNIIYSYDCTCGAGYVGRTERPLWKRIDEHLPKWCLAGRSRPRSTAPPSSAVTRHALSCPSTQDKANFKIVKSCRTAFELRISEAVCIRLTSPVLCIQKDFLFDCQLV